MVVRSSQEASVQEFKHKGAEGYLFKSKAIKMGDNVFANRLVWKAA